MNGDFIANLFSGPNAYREIMSVIAGSIILTLFGFAYEPQLLAYSGFNILTNANDVVEIFLFLAFSYVVGDCTRTLGWIWMIVVRLKIPTTWIFDKKNLKKKYKLWREFFDRKSTRMLSEADENLVTHNVTEIINKIPGLMSEYQIHRNILIISNTICGALLLFINVMIVDNSQIRFGWVAFWVSFGILIAMSIYNLDNRNDMTDFRLQAGRHFLPKDKGGLL